MEGFSNEGWRRLYEEVISSSPKATSGDYVAPFSSYIGQESDELWWNASLGFSSEQMIALLEAKKKEEAFECLVSFSRAPKVHLAEVPHLQGKDDEFIDDLGDELIEARNNKTEFIDVLCTLKVTGCSDDRTRIYVEFVVIDPNFPELKDGTAHQMALEDWTTGDTRWYGGTDLRKEIPVRVQ